MKKSFLTKTLATVLSLAMVVASVAVTGTEAEAAKGKVKKVKVTAPVTNGGKLVLKKGQKKQLKVKVTATKGASKKVTYKTSNKKVAKIVKSKGKVYVKAVGKKGSAKITIISKANKKKKATLKVKIGNPIKKVSVDKLVYTTSVYDKAAAKSKKPVKSTVKYNAKKGIELKTALLEVNTTTSYNCQIKIKVSPKKVGEKKIKWSSNKTSVARVTPDGLVTPFKAGTTYIIGKTKDGTNKKIKIKVTVTESKSSEATPTPNYEKADTREEVMVEDFEQYDIGYDWESDDMLGNAGKATKGLEFVDKNCGKMTVVADPEDANNKVLKIEYSGDTQAYDYAPIFNFKLPENFEEYTGVLLDSRVISNSADCQYKAVYGYFAKYGKIKPEDYFATSMKEEDVTTKQKSGIAITNDHIRFGVDVSMVNGKDEKFNVKGGEFDMMTYNNHSFPMFYDAWKNAQTDANRAVGFFEEAGKKVGWNPNRLEVVAANIQDKSILKTKNIAFAVGSTYSGNYQGEYHLTLYLDNIRMLKGKTPCTSFKIDPVPTKVSVGNYVTILPDLDVAYEPENTTQKELLWASSDESIAKIDTTQGDPRIVGVAPGKVTITASINGNEAVKQSFEITVYASAAATEDYVVDMSKIIATKADDDTTTKIYSTVVGTFAANKLSLAFTEANNDHVVIDLGEGGMDISKFKSIKISGFAQTQMTFEVYPDGADFTADKYWERQIIVKTYPFFTGSRQYRASEGGGYGGLAEEDCYVNFKDIDMHLDMSNARYIVLKANKWDDSAVGPQYYLKSITFQKDEFDKTTLPTEAELEAAGHTKA